MPSAALRRWVSERLPRLDEIEHAHRSVGGTGPGRRVATLQINHAYAVLLSAQFQGFCRDLHSESAAAIVAAVSPAAFRQALAAEYDFGRKLDQGNPNPGNIGSDFNRLGLRFWQHMIALDARNERRQEALLMMTTWRNAIAHQEFTAVGSSAVLRLNKVREWRGVCDVLAENSDRVMQAHLRSMLGVPPW